MFQLGLTLDHQQNKAILREKVLVEMFLNK